MEKVLNSHQVIQNCINKTRSNIERTANAFSSFTSEKLNWKINSDSWSVGECLSHLVNSNGLYFEKFQSILRSNSLNDEMNFPYNQTFLGKMLAKGVDPANVKKTKTFKVFFPDSSETKKTILDDYVKSSEKLILLAEKMKTLDLKKIKLSSPVNKLIRLNLGDPLIFIPKHDERHLNQADRVMKHEHFPNL